MSQSSIADAKPKQPNRPAVSYCMKPQVVRDEKERPPVIWLSPDDSLRWARQMRWTLGWLTEALDREGKAIPGTETWVINTPQLSDTYTQLAEFGWGNGAIFPRYSTLAHACKIQSRQTIRRIHALESIGLIVKRPDKKMDGSPSSNCYGLIHPHKALRAKAICIRHPRDKETGEVQAIIPLSSSVDVNALPPFPQGREQQERPVVFIKPATPEAEAAAAQEEPGIGNMLLPPWWAVRIAIQEGIKSLYLQCLGYDRLRWLEATRQLRDPKHPGKALRGIYRNLASEAKLDLVAEEKLLTGRSLTAEQEIHQRRWKMTEIAFKALVLGDSLEQIRQRLKSNPPELIPLRQVTAMEQHEIESAIEEASRRLSRMLEEQQRLSALSDNTPHAEDAVKWVRAGVQAIRTREENRALRANGLDGIREHLWNNRALWHAPASLTQEILNATIEAIRLQE